MHCLGMRRWQPAYAPPSWSAQAAQPARGCPTTCCLPAWPRARPSQTASTASRLTRCGKWWMTRSEAKHQHGVCGPDTRAYTFKARAEHVTALRQHARQACLQALSTTLRFSLFCLGSSLPTQQICVQVEAVLLGLPVSDLPGVGWSMQRQLTDLSISTVAQLRSAGRARLQRELGDKVLTRSAWVSHYLLAVVPSC